MDPLTLIWGIITTALVGASSIISWMAREKVKWVDAELVALRKEIDAQGDKINEIRLNYLGKFDDLRVYLNENHLKVIERMTILESKWAPVYEFVTRVMISGAQPHYVKPNKRRTEDG